MKYKLRYRPERSLFKWTIVLNDPSVRSVRLHTVESFENNSSNSHAAAKRVIAMNREADIDTMLRMFYTLKMYSLEFNAMLEEAHRDQGIIKWKRKTERRKKDA